MKSFAKIVKPTPIGVYSLLLLLDNCINSPLCGYNQGAIGNVFSVCITLLSIVVLAIERIVMLRCYGKNLIVAEIVVVVVTTFMFWLFMGHLPFPTTHRYF